MRKEARVFEKNLPACSGAKVNRSSSPILARDSPIPFLPENLSLTVFVLLAFISAD